MYLRIGHYWEVQGSHTLHVKGKDNLFDSHVVCNLVEYVNVRNVLSVNVFISAECFVSECVYICSEVVLHYTGLGKCPHGHVHLLGYVYY